MFCLYFIKENESLEKKRKRILEGHITCVGSNLFRKEGFDLIEKELFKRHTFRVLTSFCIKCIDLNQK